MAARIIWSDPETDLLVSERRRRNFEFHTRFRGTRRNFGIVLPEGYIEHSITDIPLANASRNGEI
jgi:hypothetical protein